jgi:acyl-coenzyme A thioesterase PaaI-like protein
MPRHSLLSRVVVPMPDWAVLPGSLSPGCFGCGPENERGLQVQSRLERDLVVADLSLVPWQGGGPGVAHGGILATFLDELMGHVAVAHRIPAVTARFEIDFLRPAAIGSLLRGEAWLARRDGRKLWTEAEGRDGNGETCIEARALYMTVGLEHFGDALAGLSEEQLARLNPFRAGEVYP